MAAPKTHVKYRNTLTLLVLGCPAHFNVSLDLFSGMQIINEHTLEQKSDLFLK